MSGKTKRQPPTRQCTGEGVGRVHPPKLLICFGEVPPEQRSPAVRTSIDWIVQELTDHEVYIYAAGNNERRSPTLAAWIELAKRQYPGLRLTSHIFDNETHLSVIPATMSRGLRAVFT